MNILSIDWDYFINCSDDFRTMYFPDGGNEKIGSAMSTYIWSKRYAENPDIEQIKIKEKYIDQLKEVIEHNRDMYYYICADSHKHLGEFLLEESIQEKFKGKDLEIVNIDHHHDAFNIGDKLNCGNWVNKVIKAYPNVEVRWIGNEDSDPAKDDHIKSITWDDIKDETFEIVYLCRSGVWSPPHLDKQFGVLQRFINKRAGNAIFREEIPNRWDEDFKKDVKQFRQSIEHLLKLNLHAAETSNV